jgi:hypothetical protein
VNNYKLTYDISGDELGKISHIQGNVVNAQTEICSNVGKVFFQKNLMHDHESRFALVGSAVA